MTRYPAWIDGEQGTYGISFPDLPGIVAMGTTVDEALMHAEEALRDYVSEAERAGEAITPPSAIERVETPAGHTLVSIPLIRCRAGAYAPISRSTRESQRSSMAKLDGEA